MFFNRADEENCGPESTQLVTRECITAQGLICPWKKDSLRPTCCRYSRPTCSIAFRRLFMRSSSRRLQAESVDRFLCDLTFYFLACNSRNPSLFGSNLLRLSLSLFLQALSRKSIPTDLLIGEEGVLEPAGYFLSNGSFSSFWVRGLVYYLLYTSMQHFEM